MLTRRSSKKSKLTVTLGNFGFLRSFSASISSIEDNYLMHYEKISQDGKILISKNSFSESISFPQSPNVELDPKGNIHLIWWGLDDKESDVFYVKLNDDGKKMFSPYSITKYTKPSSYYTQPSSYNFIISLGILIIAFIVILLFVRFIKKRKNKPYNDFDVHTDHSE